ncbi:right-handed parallel beta-helix repeat-containing protein [Amnibacterium flavum]
MGGLKKGAWGARFGIGIVIGALTTTAGMAAAAPAFAVDSGSVAGSAYYASPSGSGDTCSDTEPCALQSAIDYTATGGEIRLLPGDYGVQKLKSKAAIRGAVTIKPLTPDTVVFGQLLTYVPGVTWTGVAVNGTTYVYPPATGTRLRDIHVSGGGTFIRSTDVGVYDSLFEGGHSIDGIQVKDSSRVTLERNVIRDFDQNGSSGLHADCVQVFDSNSVTVRANSISNCYNAGIIVSGGGGVGVDGLLIESNFIQGCVVRSSDCEVGTVIDARLDISQDVVIRNNMLLNGPVRIASTPGASFDRNVIDYLSSCDSAITNSIVARWNTGMCATPDAIGSNGNRVGTVEVVDAAAGDLHVVDIAQVSINPSGGVPAARDFDGQAMRGELAGADDPEGAGPARPPVGGGSGGGVDVPSTPSDQTGPTVAILDGESVDWSLASTDPVSLSVEANDDSGVTSVRLAWGRFSAPLDEGEDGIWSLSAPITGVPEGTYEVVAVARDSNGNVSISEPISVSVGP